MSGFMYGDGIFLFISGDFGTFLKATYNAVDGVNEILSAYVFVVMTRGYEGCLVTLAISAPENPGV